MKFLNWIECNFYTDQLYLGLLTSALWRENHINDMAYLGRIKSINLGYSNQSSFRNSKLIGWTEGRKKEVLELEVEQKVSKDFDYTNLDNLALVLWGIKAKHNFFDGVKVISNMKMARFVAKELVKQWLSRTFNDIESFEDLEELQVLLDNFGFKVSLPNRDYITAGYCCKDCDGCIGQYIKHRLIHMTSDWKKVLDF